jgi:hypothetical protein
MVEALRFRMDRLLIFPPLIYLGNFLWRDWQLEVVAYLLWALGVLIWTPWIILRVDSRRGDTARSAAILGYGLLAWPLFLLILIVAPERSRFLVAFPFVCLWGAAAMALAAWNTSPPRPSKARAGLLAGGGLVFGLYAAALVGALLGAILGRYPVENAFIWFGLCLAAMFGAAMVFASFKLLKAAGQALRAA